MAGSTRTRSPGCATGCTTSSTPAREYVVLRLGDAEIGDATALGFFVGTHHRARRAGRRLVVSEASERTARLLRASRLDRVLVSAELGAPAGPRQGYPMAGAPVGVAVAPLTAYLRH